MGGAASRADGHRRASLVVWALAAGSAHAWEASNPVVVSQDEDRFWNYDCGWRTWAAGELRLAGDDRVLGQRDRRQGEGRAARRHCPIWGTDEYLYASDG